MNSSSGPRAHSIAHAALSICGTILIFAAVLLLQNLVAQVAVVLGGVLLLQAGVWKLAEPFLPEERSNLELRAETDRFLGLVREMARLQRNATAADGTDESFDPATAGSELERIRAEMMASVDRIHALADPEPMEPAAR